jgi:hypothetical protein
LEIAAENAVVAEVTAVVAEETEAAEVAVEAETAHAQVVPEETTRNGLP